MKKPPVRSIRTKRDFQGAAAVVDKMRRKNERESDDERRLQALLHEIEKFDGENAADDDGYVEETIEDLPRRRWSDEL